MDRDDRQKLRNELVNIIKQDDELRKRRKMKHGLTNSSSVSNGKKYNANNESSRSINKTTKEGINFKSLSSSTTKTASSSSFVPNSSLFDESKSNLGLSGASKYRDRASERRSGKDEIEFDNDKDTKETSSIDIPFTHDIKGLDFELLEKTKKVLETKNVKSKQVSSTSEKNNWKNHILDVVISDPLNFTSPIKADKIKFFVNLSLRLHKSPLIIKQDPKNDNNNSAYNDLKVLLSCGYIKGQETTSSISQNENDVEEKIAKAQDDFDMFGDIDEINEDNEKYKINENMPQNKVFLEDMFKENTTNDIDNLNQIQQSEINNVNYANLPTMDDINANELILLLKYIDIELTNRGVQV